jgi:GTP-binding protein of the ras superfamily involved in termination of M-phase
MSSSSASTTSSSSASTTSTTSSTTSTDTSKEKEEKKKDGDDEKSKGNLLDDLGKAKKKILVKVGMVGDSQIGKTSLMVKYVENKFQEEYIETLGNPSNSFSSLSLFTLLFSFVLSGVSFMEKTIALKNTDVTFSIWDLGGQQEYLHMLPLVCNEAVRCSVSPSFSSSFSLNSLLSFCLAGGNFVYV